MAWIFENSNCSIGKWVTEIQAFNFLIFAIENLLLPKNSSKSVKAVITETAYTTIATATLIRLMSVSSSV